MSALVEKAARLTVEGRVESVPGEVFRVRGDHGTYLVAVDGADAVCSCPATGTCSHLLAARHAYAKRQAMYADLFGHGDPADNLEARRHGDLFGAQRETAGEPA